MSQNKLYALIIGIDAYTHVRPLHGAVNDANAVDEYLRGDIVQNSFAQVDIQILRDNEATKSAIVEGFEKHLGKAGKGDSTLFYFAGHGVREKTQVKAFKDSETDGKFGTLVCVDSKVGAAGATQDTFLADKELRFLIKKLEKKGSDLVVLFDCCHSGDSTRSLASATVPDGARQIERYGLEARGWEGFIFHEEISEEKAQSSHISEILPQGKHVMLAACRDVELAWEFAGRGAFTGALIDELKKHQGRIHYFDLQSRIRNRMRTKGEQQQTPQFYFFSPKQELKYLNFLTNEPNENPVFGSVVYNRDNDHWRINLGAIHGVPIDNFQERKVYIQDVHDASTNSEAIISAVFPGYSVIKSNSLSKDGTYRGQINGLAIRPLNIFITGELQGVNHAIKEIGAEIQDATSQYVELVETEEEADYVLRAKDGTYITTLPSDDRPIIGGIRYNSGGNLLDGKGKISYTDLVQMARWTFFRDLNHYPKDSDWEKNTDFPTQPVELKIFQKMPDGSEKLCDISSGKYKIEMTEGFAEGEPKAFIRAELVNHAQEELYCTMTYLSELFGVMTNIMERNNGWLNTGEKFKTVPAEGPYIPISLSNYIVEDGWDGITSYFKVLVSTETFDLGHLEMGDLPKPGASGQGATRGFGIPKPQDRAPEPKWAVYTLEFFVPNHFLTKSSHAPEEPV